MIGANSEVSPGITAYLIGLSEFQTQHQGEFIFSRKDYKKIALVCQWKNVDWRSRFYANYVVVNVIFLPGLKAGI